MQVRILGAHQGESCRTHFGSILVDGILALDAGSLTSMLDLSEQAALFCVLLTHGHFDHIKDLGSLGFNLMERCQVRICCMHETRAAIEATILNDKTWINFFVRPTPEAPTFIYTPVEPGQSLSLAGYQVRPISVIHAVPAVAYEIASPEAGTLLYTGDNGPGSAGAWGSSAPDLLITEVTYPDAQASLAAEHGHLSPRLLAEELRTYRSIRGFVPNVLAVHVNPYYEAQIAAELSTVASDLGVDVRVAEEGSTIAVGSPRVGPLL